MTVVNKEIKVGQIRVIGVTSSSVLLVGDTERISLASAFDTPPEAFIVGPFVPLGAAR
ncbi:Probable spore germination protein gerPD [Chlamydia abortus]|nr:Probable spore germination protein gerPD [Chlamydia abortus]